jgi:cell division protein FtsB
MLGVRRKYRIRRFFGSGIAFAVVLLLFVVFVHAAFSMYLNAKEAQDKRDLARAELKRLEARESDLETEVAKLSSDRGVEEELRNRYFIAKEGERVAVVNVDRPNDGVEPRKIEKRGFWKKILSAVGFSGE